MTETVHITPRFPPQIDGLGDYSRLLAESLRTDHGIGSRFIVGDTEWARAADDDATLFPAEAVRRRDAAELLRLLGDDHTVILHYVCYGYHHRGIPFWINRALRSWKMSGRNRRLLVVFHELWASGPPWKSECYFGPIQRHLVRGLHRLCDAAMTSTPVMFRMLESLAPGKTAFQPIPSNFPGLASQRREPAPGGPVRVVIFGLAHSRLRSVQVHGRLLAALHREGLLARVDVVGKTEGNGLETRLLRSFLPDDRIHVAGEVTPEEGARLLADADLFLSYYPSAFLCKSGALMAALANGCVPVLPETRNAEPLTEGRELLACDGSEPEIGRLVARIREDVLPVVAEAGRRWLEENASWKVVSGRVSRLLLNKPVVPIRP